MSGKQVVILTDNDDPGQQYAMQVTDILTSLDPPAMVQVVDLPDSPRAAISWSGSLLNLMLWSQPTSGPLS